MVRNVLIAGALIASFAMPAFAASTTTTTTAPAAKPAPKLYFVEDVGGVCKVSDAMAAAPTLTAPDKLEPSTKGYKSLASAKADLAKLVKAKTCKTA
ncbi:MAG TPA: hypothetical protein VHA70_11715 [Bauldia sp.]|nr:hypothetical protein [Bauldia sp.]